MRSLRSIAIALFRNAVALLTLAGVARLPAVDVCAALAVDHERGNAFVCRGDQVVVADIDHLDAGATSRFTAGGTVDALQYASASQVLAVGVRAESRIELWSIAEPNAPRRRGVIPVAVTAKGSSGHWLTWSGHDLIVATGDALRVFDCSDPASPLEVDLPEPVRTIGAQLVSVREDGARLFVNGIPPGHPDQANLYLIDVRTPRSAAILATRSWFGSVVATAGLDLAWYPGGVAETYAGRYGSIRLGIIPTTGDTFGEERTYLGDTPPASNALYDGRVAVGDGFLYGTFSDGIAVIDRAAIGSGGARSLREFVYTSTLAPSDGATKIHALVRHRQRLLGACGSTGILACDISAEQPRVIALYPLFSTNVGPRERGSLRVKMGGTTLTDGGSYALDWTGGNTDHMSLPFTVESLGPDQLRVDAIHATATTNCSVAAEGKPSPLLLAGRSSNVSVTLRPIAPGPVAVTFRLFSSDVTDGSLVWTVTLVSPVGDVSPPAAPFLRAIRENGTGHPLLSAVCEPGATVELLIDGVLSRTLHADADTGEWEYRSEQPDGEYRVAISAIDAAGNRSATSNERTLVVIGNRASATRTVRIDVVPGTGIKARVDGDLKPLPAAFSGRSASSPTIVRFETVAGEG